MCERCRYSQNSGDEFNQLLASHTKRRKRVSSFLCYYRYYFKQNNNKDTVLYATQASIGHRDAPCADICPIQATATVPVIQPTLLCRSGITTLGLNTDASSGVIVA